MNESVIKISELNYLYNISSSDFFPIVHITSSTTDRTDIYALNNWMTNSGSCLSASYAITASYSKYASTASYCPQQPQISCSYASQSTWAYDAVLATRSIDTDISGITYNFPYWNNSGISGSLTPSTALFFYSQGAPTYGLVVHDSASTLLNYTQTWPTHRPDFLTYNFNPDANRVGGFGFASLGIQSAWPITSNTFVGTDQKVYGFTTGSFPSYTASIYDPQFQITNSYFSGSAGNSTSGSFYTIPTTAGALGSIFNGHWVRIFSRGKVDGILDSAFAGAVVTSNHSAMGEVNVNTEKVGGLISLQVLTPMYGSNVNQMIDLYVSIGLGELSATVLRSNVYNGNQIIRSIRLHNVSQGLVDPAYSMDILLNGLSPLDNYFTITCQSWQGIRFLKWANVDPWPFTNTSSNDIRSDSTQLVFPVSPGFYSNVTKQQNYYVQGKNVVIWPTPNEITQSGVTAPQNVSNNSLFVSGSVATNTSYYCNNSPGLTVTASYGASKLMFAGGILVGKSP